jgi:N-glycosidase YbiA
MLRCLEWKFTQNEDLKQILLDTKPALLIENSPKDSYWGCGKDGKGQNKLGISLMKVRDEILS